MIVGKERGVGCNFCDRSKLSASGTNLIFPYDFVYTLNREGKSGLVARICEDCIKDLLIKITLNQITT